MYEFLTHGEFRHRGYGAVTIGLLEGKVTELGADSVGLHVFGHNDAARALYEKMGYDTTSIVMSERLDEG